MFASTYHLLITTAFVAIAFVCSCKVLRQTSTARGVSCATAGWKIFLLLTYMTTSCTLKHQRSAPKDIFDESKQTLFFLENAGGGQIFLGKCTSDMEPTRVNCNTDLKAIGLVAVTKRYNDDLSQESLSASAKLESEVQAARRASPEFVAAQSDVTAATLDLGQLDAKNLQRQQSLNEATVKLAQAKSRLSDVTSQLSAIYAALANPATVGEVRAALIDQRNSLESQKGNLETISIPALQSDEIAATKSLADGNQERLVKQGNLNVVQGKITTILEGLPVSSPEIVSSQKEIDSLKGAINGMEGIKPFLGATGVSFPSNTLPVTLAYIYPRFVDAWYKSYNGSPAGLFSTAFSEPGVTRSFSNGAKVKTISRDNMHGVIHLEVTGVPGITTRAEWDWNVSCKIASGFVYPCEPRVPSSIHLNEVVGYYSKGQSVCNYFATPWVCSVQYEYIWCVIKGNGPAEISEISFTPAGFTISGFRPIAVQFKNILSQWNDVCIGGSSPAPSPEGCLDKVCQNSTDAESNKIRDLTRSGGAFSDFYSAVNP